MTTGTTRGTAVRDEARDALERGEAHLRRLQSPEGYWWGELESNPTITAEHVFLLEALGLADDGLRRRLANELLATQGEDGGWRVWYSGPGRPVDHRRGVLRAAALRRARLRPAPGPRARGGARAAAASTARASSPSSGSPCSAATPGRRCRRCPPEMILLPPRAPMSPYRFASWARGTFVALMVVLTRNPTFPQPVGLDELFLEPPGAGPSPRPKTPGPVDPGAEPQPDARAPLQPAPHPPAAPARRGPGGALDLRAPGGGRLLGRHPAARGSTRSWPCTRSGFPLDHPVIARALAGFEGTFALDLDDGERLRIQACLSPVWDTALAAIALADAGAPPDDPALAASAEWLLSKEVVALRRLARGGPARAPRRLVVRVRQRELPRHGRHRRGPDRPAPLRPPAAPTRRVRRGVDWLLAMQSANGGWGSFDVDNDRAVMTQIPICDFGEVIDPPTEDVTAHVVEALVECGLPREHPAVRRGVDFLWRTQRADGSWWGRWGVNHVYGTGAALPALAAAGGGHGRRARAARGGVAGRSPERATAAGARAC